MLLINNVGMGCCLYNFYTMNRKISWEEYFLGLVQLSAMRSKDPNTQVGAVVVNQDNRIIGMGYNGMPNGDDTFPWTREGEDKDTKYPYVVHAELNAILNTTAPTKGSSLYVSLFPCSACAKLIVQSGIKEVCFIDDKYHDTKDAEIARIIFDKSGVKYRKGQSIKVEIK